MLNEAGKLRGYQWELERQCHARMINAFVVCVAIIPAIAATLIGSGSELWPTILAALGAILAWSTLAFLKNWHYGSLSRKAKADADQVEREWVVIARPKQRR